MASDGICFPCESGASRNVGCPLLLVLEPRLVSEPLIMDWEADAALSLWVNSIDRLVLLPSRESWLSKLLGSSAEFTCNAWLIAIKSLVLINAPWDKALELLEELSVCESSSESLALKCPDSLLFDTFKIGIGDRGRLLESLWGTGALLDTLDWCFDHSTLLLTDIDLDFLVLVARASL